MYENRRKTAIARFGETVVFKHLTENGYKCAPLGDYFPCFDIETSKDAKKYLVSVKTRNHTTDKNDEKTDCYNLFYKKKKGDDLDAEVKKAEDIAQQRNAVQMWAAVRVDVERQLYDVYWGFVAELKNKKQIPMSPNDRRRHKKLAENVFDPRIDPAWSNVRRRSVVREVRSSAPQI